MSSTRIRDSELRSHVYSGPSGIHGTGLFAARDITAGEYIGTFWGPEAKRDGSHVLWVYDIDNPDHMVGRHGRNLLRFLNHAEPGNAEFDGFDLFARVAIRQHAEITINYEAG